MGCSVAKWQAIVNQLVTKVQRCAHTKVWAVIGETFEDIDIKSGKGRQSQLIGNLSLIHLSTNDCN